MFLLCDGTLELETVASTLARPCARSCVSRRLRGRGREEGRTAGGAERREYDGRRARAMGVGPPFKMASSSPFALAWTMSNPSKSPCRPVGASPTPPSENAAPLLVPFGPEVSCSVASPINARFNTCGAIYTRPAYYIESIGAVYEAHAHVPSVPAARRPVTCYSIGMCGIASSGHDR